MAAPQVQDLQSLIGQYQTALAPQSQQIDTEIAANDTSGQQQTQGIDAQKTTAFKGITQQANDRGGYFSGFTPDAEATYTAGTYLPALAQLQATIAGTRNTLLGKKADLSTTANTSALSERSNEQSAFNTWQQQQDQMAQQEKLQQEQEAFTAAQNAADRTQKTQLAGQSAGSDTAAQLSADRASIVGELSKVTGSDGYVSPGSYATAKNAWVGEGYDAKQFDSYFGGFKNPKNKNYK
jgi:hypothetical protein